MLPLVTVKVNRNVKNAANSANSTSAAKKRLFTVGKQHSNGAEQIVENPEKKAESQRIGKRAELFGKTDKIGHQRNILPKKELSFGFAVSV